MKHTQGKWTSRKTSTGIVYVGSENVERICTVEGLQDGVNNKEKEKEQLANAKLIAAAPELLEALKNLLESVENNIDPTGKTRQLVKDQAKQAIKKATS